MAVTPHNFVKIYLLRQRLGTMLVYCTKNCMLLDPSGDKAVDIPRRVPTGTKYIKSTIINSNSRFSSSPNHAPCGSRLSRFTGSALHGLPLALLSSILYPRPDPFVDDPYNPLRYIAANSLTGVAFCQSFFVLDHLPAHHGIQHSFYS